MYKYTLTKLMDHPCLAHSCPPVQCPRHREVGMHYLSRHITFIGGTLYAAPQTLQYISAPYASQSRRESTRPCAA